MLELNTPQLKLKRFTLYSSDLPSNEFRISQYIAEYVKPNLSKLGKRSEFRRKKRKLRIININGLIKRYFMEILF